MWGSIIYFCPTIYNRSFAYYSVLTSFDINSMYIEVPDLSFCAYLPYCQIKLASANCHFNVRYKYSVCRSDMNVSDVYHLTIKILISKIRVVVTALFLWSLLFCIEDIFLNVLNNKNIKILAQ